MDTTTRTFGKRKPAPAGWTVVARFEDGSMEVTDPADRSPTARNFVVEADGTWTPIN